MLNEEVTKQMMYVFTDPLFKMGFFDFFLKMQQEGIEAARKFWRTAAEENMPVTNAGEMFERMIDFFIILGFVPRIKYEEVMKENKNLKEENKFLKDALRELQANLVKEWGEKGQQVWDASIDQQLEVHREIAKNFFEMSRQLRVSA